MENLHTAKGVDALPSKEQHKKDIQEKLHGLLAESKITFQQFLAACELNNVLPF